MHTLNAPVGAEAEAGDLGRDDMSRMAEACFRVTGMLDVDDAVQALVDEARSITDARYGVLVTFDDAGHLEDMVMSGMSPAERERLSGLPEGQQLFAHLRHLPGALRVRNLQSYTASLGLPAGTIFAESFLGVPLRHLGKQIGCVFLGGKLDGAEFTADNERILGMFASHAAVVLTNARSYRDEQRAKAELEALIDDSPLGVLVFDARTGNLLTVNEETRRIVGGMRGRGHSLEALLGVMTFRHPDGHELDLDELPLTRALSSGSTVRAEELIIEHADGQTVRILVNAKPIRSEEGEIVSVVATIQDMSPLEEVERQRAEFLGMVSRGLRTPLTTIKGSTATVLSSSARPDPQEMLQFFQIIDEQADRLRELTADLLEISRIETGKLSVAPRPTDVAELVSEAARAFEQSDATQRLRLVLEPELPPVAAETSRLFQVFRNLLGIASLLSPRGSTITLTASKSDAHVAIYIAFQGTEIPADDRPHIFSKLYRLSDESAHTASTNLGLAISKGIVEAHGGRIWATSDAPARGSQFVFTLPIDSADNASEYAAPPLERTSDQPSTSSAIREAIVVLDSDPRLLRYVRDELSGAGFAPYLADGYPMLKDLVRTRRPSLLLVDVNVLSLDGIAWESRLSDISDVPTIALCDRESDPDLSAALASGAVDYLTKPFSPNELLARVKIALSRATASITDDRDHLFVLKDLSINYAARTVTVAGRPVQLSATEYNLLAELSSNAGRVLTQHHLLQSVWGPTYMDNSQILRTYIRYLRKKLHDDVSDPKYIFTTPSVGYHMPSPPVTDAGDRLP